MKINGSLVFDASSASEISNLRVQKIDGSSVPAYTTSDIGRVIFVTTTGGSYSANTLYYGSAAASNWVAIATGGNAAALQTEVDAIETSLGSIVNGSGVWQVGTITGPAFTGTEATLTAVLQAISNYANANNTLAELDDVTLTSTTAGDYLKYNGIAWVNDAFTLTDVTDVTATAAQVNVLATIPATLTGTELGFVDGVTAPIQGQLDNKQALDAGLTSMAALTGPGFVTVDATGNVVSSRNLVAPAAGFSITPTDGSADPVFALTNDLAAYEGLGSFGYVVRTADGSATTRSLSTNTADIVITGAADGVSTDTTFALATVTQAASGTFSKITLDTKGRVTGNTAVVLGDITSLVDGTYVNVTGDSMTGNLIMGAGAFVKLNETAVAGNDAVNKAYVDAATNGLSWKKAVVAASTGNLSLTGLGAVDGVTIVDGDRVLVKDQTTASGNGIYVVGSGAWVRAADMDAAAEFDGAAVFVQQGTVNEGQGFTETLTVTTVGTSPVAFSQFSGGQAFVWGTGLSNSGNTIFVNLGAGISELPTDEIGIDVIAGKAVQLTSTASGGQLTFVLDTGSGLDQSATGLKISAAGVTNAMLANPQFTLNGDTGTDSFVLGDILQIKGVSTQGISTATSESPAGTSTVTITAADASFTQKGVASFASGDFAITAGAVSIKAAGVDNAQLVNSFITINGVDALGASNTDDVALGEALTIVGAVGSPVSTVVAANSVAISVRDATTAVKGVASFNTVDFSVTGGAVSAIAKGLDALTDVTITGTPAAGETLVANGSGQFANKKVYHLETVSVAATTWTVTHSLGQQYCNVTVIDSTDNMVIPQSVVFTSSTVLTVTFNTAVAGKVVVMGIA